MARADSKECIQCGKIYTRNKRTLTQWEASKWCSPKCLGDYRNGDRHFAWKSDPSYETLHKYVGYKFEDKKECEECGATEHLHWSNKSGKYLRDRSDWQVLCPKCHSWYDVKYLGKKVGRELKTRCLRGHEYTESNTYRHKNGTRACKACWKSRYYINKGVV